MNWRGISSSLGLVLLGLTACGPSLLDRWIEIDKVTPADCPRADALVEEYARAGAVPGEVRTVRAHVNTLCASEAYTRGNLEQAEVRAKHALDDEPGNSLAQSILDQVAERRKAGPRRQAARATLENPAPAVGAVRFRTKRSFGSEALSS